MVRLLGTYIGLCLLLGCSADHHADRGKAALDAHDLVEAEARYRQAIARDARHVGALSGLGWTYLLAGQTDAATGAFERCIDVAPASSTCLRGQAAVASATGNPAQARSLLNKALMSDPRDGGVKSSLALLSLTAGDLDEAGTAYETLVAQFPERAEYRVGLAEVQLRKDQYEAALATIDAALRLTNTPVRYSAMLFQTQARTLVAATADRVDPARCGAPAPQVRAWLDAADVATESAQSTGVPLPDLPVVRRLGRRRRAMGDASCPLAE